MTREELIRYGKDYLCDLIMSCCEEVSNIHKEFVIEAVKALEQEPSKDCISRQSVKDEMIKYGFLSPDMTVTEFVEDVLQPIATDKKEKELRTEGKEPCEMSAEEYRQRMIQAFHNAGADELIGVCVLPKEEEFKLLEGMLKDRYNREHNDDLVSKQQVIKAVDSHTFETDGGLCLDDDISCILEDLPPSSTQE